MWIEYDHCKTIIGHILLVDIVKPKTVRLEPPWIPTHRQIELNSIHRVSEGPGELMPPQGSDHRFLQVLELIGEAPRFFIVLVLGRRGVPVHSEYWLGHGRFCSKDTGAQRDVLKLCLASSAFITQPLPLWRRKAVWAQSFHPAVMSQTALVVTAVY